VLCEVLEFWSSKILSLLFGGVEEERKRMSERVDRMERGRKKRDKERNRAKQKESARAEEERRQQKRK